MATTKKTTKQMVKKIAKAGVTAKDIERARIAKKIQEFAQDILTGKKEGIALIYEKEKDGHSLTSIAHEFTHKDTHCLIDHLIGIIHPEFKDIAKLMGGLFGKK